MQKTLTNARVRHELLDRLERLNPDATPRLGTMNAPQMLAHLVDWMQMAKGELETAVGNRVVRYPPLKQLVIYWLPFPKGIPTAPELIRRQPSAWAVEHAVMCRHIESFAKRDPNATWPVHPAFGKLSRRAWGVLAYRHTDHHLRQFGT